MFISEYIFGKCSKNQDFIFEMVKFLKLFQAKHPQKKWRIGYVYLKESFDNSFNMGYCGRGLDKNFNLSVFIESNNEFGI